MAGGEAWNEVIRDEDAGTSRARDDEAWFTSKTGRELTSDDLVFLTKCVATFVRRCPPHADRDELASAAGLGLVLASRRFDPTKGASWSSYAWRRMTGAMLDYVRVALQTRRAEPMMRPLSFSARIPGTDPDASPVTLEDAIADTADVAEDALGQIAMEALLDEIAGLPPREREVLLADLRGELTHEMAARLGVSSSRVSQLKARARERLRAAAA